MEPAFLFNKCYEDMRAIGRRGGRAAGRTRRLRLAAQAPVVQVADQPHQETAAEAIALLDREFTHLVGAERRTSRRPAA